LDPKTWKAPQRREEHSAAPFFAFSTVARGCLIEWEVLQQASVDRLPELHCDSMVPSLFLSLWWPLSYQPLHL
jgi:hypothetical protein